MGRQVAKAGPRGGGKGQRAGYGCAIGGAAERGQRQAGNGARREGCERRGGVGQKEGELAGGRIQLRQRLYLCGQRKAQGVGQSIPVAVSRVNVQTGRIIADGKGRRRHGQPIRRQGQRDGESLVGIDSGVTEGQLRPRHRQRDRHRHRARRFIIACHHHHTCIDPSLGQRFGGKGELHWHAGCAGCRSCQRFDHQPGRRCRQAGAPLQVEMEIGAAAVANPQRLGDSPPTLQRRRHRQRLDHQRRQGNQGCGQLQIATFKRRRRRPILCHRHIVSHTRFYHRQRGVGRRRRQTEAIGQRAPLTTPERRQRRVAATDGFDAQIARHRWCDRVPNGAAALVVGARRQRVISGNGGCGRLDPIVKVGSANDSMVGKFIMQRWRHNDQSGRSRGSDRGSDAR